MRSACFVIAKNPGLPESGYDKASPENDRIVYAVHDEGIHIPYGVPNCHCRSPFR